MENEPAENERIKLNRELEDEQSKLLDTIMDCYAEAILTPFESRYILRKPGKKVEKKIKKSLQKVNKT